MQSEEVSEKLPIRVSASLMVFLTASPADVQRVTAVCCNQCLCSFVLSNNYALIVETNKAL